MRLMEGVLEKEKERFSQEQNNLTRDKKMVRNESDYLLLENIELKSRERVLREAKDDLQKKYINKRDSKIFLDLEHESLKKNHCELQKELKSTYSKLQTALLDSDTHKLAKTDFQRQLVHQNIMNSQKEIKLENKLRIAQGKVEVAENTARQKQQEFYRKAEELEKVLQEKRAILEILARNGIHFYEGQTRGN